MYCCFFFFLFEGELISLFLNAGLDSYLGFVSRLCVVFTDGIDYDEYLSTVSKRVH